MFIGGQKQALATERQSTIDKMLPGPKERDQFGWLHVLSILLGVALFLSGMAALVGAILGKLQLQVAAPVTVALVVLAALTTQLEKLQARLRARAEEQTRLHAAAQQRQHEWVRLVAYLGPLDSADPAVLGIARSKILEQVEQQRTKPVYIKRNVDEEVKNRLRAWEPFILIRGDLAAGKSRTAWEVALAADLGSHIVLVPNRDAVQRDQLRQILEFLNPGELGEPPALLWLDDVHQYLKSGALTRNVLTRFRQHQVLVVATIRQREYARLFSEADGGGSEQPELDLAEEASRTLQLAYDVELSFKLKTTTERALATELFGDHNWNRDGLGAVLILAQELVRRFTSGKEFQASLICAAVDWQRAGVRRPIGRHELEQLWRSYLEIKQWRQPTIADFQKALDWATEAIDDSDTALLYVHDEGGHAYNAHHYVVAYRDGQGEPGRHQEEVPAEAWLRIVAGVTPDEALAVGLEALERDQLETALQAWERAATSVEEVTVATALGRKGVALTWLGRREQAIQAWDQVDRRFRENPLPALREQLAKALHNKGLVLGQLGRLEPAIEAWDQVERRFGEDPLPALREQVATALVNKGVVLRQLGRLEPAIEAWDQVERRFGKDPQPALREQVARALFNKGRALGQLGRPEREIELYDQVDRHFGDDPLPALRKQVASALVNRGGALGQFGRLEQAIEACDQVERRFGEDRLPALREHVARALVNKGVVLRQLRQLERAIEAWDQVERRFGEHPLPPLSEQVARALFNKGWTLGQLGRSEQEIELYDQVERRFGEHPLPGLREQVARALVNKGAALGQMGRFEQAIDACDQVERRFGEDPLPALSEQVARALVNKGWALGRLGRTEQAIEACDHVERRFGNTANPAVLELVAKVRTNKRLFLSPSWERPS